MSAITYIARRGADPENTLGMWMVDDAGGVIGVDPVEKIVNSEFDFDSDWIKGDGWSISGGLAVCDGTQSANTFLSQAVGGLVIGQIYKVLFRVESRASGFVRFNILGTLVTEGEAKTAQGVYVVYFKPTSTSHRVDIVANSEFSGSIDYMSVVASNQLVEYGNFPGATNGWTEHNATLIAAANRLNITAASSTGNGCWATQAIQTQVGQKYYFKYDFISAQNGTAYARITNNQSGVAPSILNKTYPAGYSGTTSAIAFVATESVTYVAFGVVDFDYPASPAVVVFDKATVTLAMDDISPNGEGVEVIGQLAGSPVSQGSNLTGWSGFSTKSYLELPHSPHLDYAGDFFVCGWLKNTATGPNYAISRGIKDSIATPLWGIRGSSDTAISININNVIVVDSGQYTSETYKHVCITKSGGILSIYIDSVLSGSAASAIDLTSIGASVIFGNWVSPSASSAFGGSLALWKTAGYAPSTEQIQDWYKQESRLFLKNSPLQIVGKSYSMDVDHQSINATDKTDSASPRSYGGNSQTIIIDEYTEYQCTTNALTGLEKNRFRKFLRSAYGQEITLDQYGTIASPDEPFTGEVVSSSHSISRVGNLNDTFTFSYKVREI